MRDIHRLNEIKDAIDKYRLEMNDISLKRLELARHERDAWKEMNNVLMADRPDLVSEYFGSLKRRPEV